MIWVVAVVVVGLIAVLAELMLSFQKKADELRQIQSPIKRRIRAHQEAMQEAVKNIENAASGRIDELDMQMPAYTNQLTGFGKRLSEVETEIFGADYDPTAPVVEEETDFLADQSEDGKDEEEGDPSEKAAKRAREILDEVEGHKTSLERDLEVVKRTVALLEGKLNRGSG